MNILHTGESSSIWTDTVPVSEFPALKKDLNVDVCIVGGGIAGLTTAYILLKEGLSVCVLESYEIASGQTGRTTAHFSTAQDDRYFQIEKFHGSEAARLVAESHKAAIDKVESIVASENINCDLEILDGYLFSDGDVDGLKNLEKELIAATSAGLTDTKFLEETPLHFFITGPCLQFPHQLELNPLKYINGLTKCITSSGGQIYTDSHVVSVVGGSPAKVKTEGSDTVTCKYVVVATNSPINDVFAIHTKQAAYRTYAIGLRVPKNSISKALYWDNLDPYHYIRLAPDKTNDYDVLIVGGEDHKTGQDEFPENHYSLLESWARARFPLTTDLLYQWSGQVMEPVDGLAFLGHNPMDRDNVFVITGDSGNGMTYATIGAMLIADQIMKRDNPWEKIYAPSRKTLGAATEFIKENANVVAQYADWLSVKSEPELSTLAVGEGVVFRHGIHMIAAYKDHHNHVKYLSAACPHLGGVVHWNKAEKSWDCPCHGSRFDCHGKVIEGPAFTDLKEAEVAKESSTFFANYPVLNS